MNIQHPRWEWVGSGEIWGNVPCMNPGSVYTSTNNVGVVRFVRFQNRYSPFFCRKIIIYCVHCLVPYQAAIMVVYH